MADEKKSKLPWGMSEKELKPNSVQSLPKSTLEAFSIGMANPALKKNVFQKSKEEKERKKKKEEEETAKVLHDFVTTFEETSKTKMNFIRGAVINPDKDTTGIAGTLYEPPGAKAKSSKQEQKPLMPTPQVVPPSKPTSSKKKDKDSKKKSILEMFGDELKRMQEERKGRQQKRSGGPSIEEEEEITENPYTIPDEPLLADIPKGSSSSTSDALSTNLYIGNINPKMNEEMLCQHFGKFGALASVKIMWPRTEEERSRNRNCGFVAFMRRKDAEKALDAMKGSTILGHEVEIGWGKTVPLPPTPFYVSPDHSEEINKFIPDPPSGFPFNARPISRRSRSSARGGSYNNMPPPGTAMDDGNRDDHYEDDPTNQSFEERLYNSIIKVVLPSDREILCLIHRMIEFIIREGPMFEAMIMNKEMGNQKFRFLFDNTCSEHIYYRWKLFSILQGDSPETWKTDEFRMFENGSLWRPPPLKNLRGKVHPPIMEIVKRGQLPQENRNFLEDMLRNVTMERAKIREGMIWCMEHAESSDEIVECITESLTLMETPLPLKVARLYLLTDILQNCNAHVSCAARYRRGFEGKMLPIMEHFHDVMIKIESKLRLESFKKRVLRCLQSWDTTTIYHFNFIDKLREQFIGKTQEELEKKKAFETVAALMSLGKGGGDNDVTSDTDDYKPIDFSGGQTTFVVDEDIDGEPLPDPDVDGVPLFAADDIDGVPMEEEEAVYAPPTVPSNNAPPPKPGSSTVVHSKWELVDYGQGSSSDEEEMSSLTTKEPVKMPSKMSSTDSAASNVDSNNDQVMENREKLREVEVKVIELMEALESSGSYTQTEIQERTTRFREKLLKEVEGKSKQSSDDKPSDSDKKESNITSDKTRSQSSRDNSTPPPDRKDRSRSPLSRSSKKKHSSESSKRRSGSRESRHKKHKSPSTGSRTRSRSRSPRGKHHSKGRSPRRSSSRKERHRSRSSSPHKSRKSSGSRK